MARLFGRLVALGLARNRSATIRGEHRAPATSAGVGGELAG